MIGQASPNPSKVTFGALVFVGAAAGATIGSMSTRMFMDTSTTVVCDCDCCDGANDPPPVGNPLQSATFPWYPPMPSKLSCGLTSGGSPRITILATAAVYDDPQKEGERRAAILRLCLDPDRGDGTPLSQRLNLAGTVTGNSDESWFCGRDEARDCPYYRCQDTLKDIAFGIGVDPFKPFDLPLVDTDTDTKNGIGNPECWQCQGTYLNNSESCISALGANKSDFMPVVAVLDGVADPSSAPRCVNNSETLEFGAGACGYDSEGASQGRTAQNWTSLGRRTVGTPFTPDPLQCPPQGGVTPSYQYSCLEMNSSHLYPINSIGKLVSAEHEPVDNNHIPGVGLTAALLPKKFLGFGPTSTGNEVSLVALAYEEPNNPRWVITAWAPGGDVEYRLSSSSLGLSPDNIPPLGADLAARPDLNEVSQGPWGRPSELLVVKKQGNPLYYVVNTLDISGMNPVTNVANDFQPALAPSGTSAQFAEQIAGLVYVGGKYPEVIAFLDDNLQQGRVCGMTSSNSKTLPECFSIETVVVRNPNGSPGTAENALLWQGATALNP